MTQYASTSHVPSTVPTFSASQQTSSKALQPTALDPQVGRILGAAPTSQSITFNSWSPDPWTVVGTNGAALVTFSRISLTIVKPDPPAKVFYVLFTHIKSEGWTTTPPNTAPYASPFRIDIKNAAGGIIWGFDQRIGIACGVDGDLRLSETFYVDVFDQIAGAGLSIPTNVTFWRC
jgi:hypothetical protein